MITSIQHALMGAVRGIDRSKLVRPESARHNPDLAEITAGAVVALEGKTCVVKSVSRYDETSWNFRKDEKYAVYEWELFCLETGETLWFEWERDDTVVAFLSMKKLSDDPKEYGASDWKSFLNDDRLDSSLKIRSGGKTYSYDDESSWAARYYRDGTGEGTPARFYEFEAATGECLTIETWGRKGEKGIGGETDVEVWLSREIPPSAVTIVATGT